ncbi:MAG: aspartate aminotransferase family protein [Bacteroidia bacterium]|nr:aspartate aminotransferase family protein [Bacteroidia bacterium]NNK71040.1 aspartate aminotransferase family protein [Flavobacteriaceae bacterium]NNL81058.1 aspartate aminotransferase family protein [Flavobacteriaceae bacterium]
MSKTNEAVYERACNVLTGGVSRNTIFRKPHPYYVATAKGSYITDIEGVERIDFANNMASLIHGHSHPAITEAVTDQLKKGTAFTLGTEAEVKFAEHMIARSGTFERMRFVNSGTEAVMTMLKTSRVYTKKPKIAKAEGAYHGTYDYAEVSQTSNPENWGSIDKPNSNRVVDGTPQGVLDDVIIYPFNDIERTLNILNEYADEIACVLIDPVPHRVGLFPATEEFIRAIYNWTRANDALMVFDEVVTYRVNYGGKQDSFSVKPDLTAMGKMIGGGFPIGALAGRADIMEVLDPRGRILRHPHSGTFSANPVSTTAGRVAMELFDQEAVLKLNALTNTAIHQIEEAIKIADVPISIVGAGSMFRLHLQKNKPKSYREAYQTKEKKGLINELLDYMFLKENIIMINTGACMFATSLTQKEVDRLSEGLLNGFKLLKPKLHRLVGVY